MGAFRYCEHCGEPQKPISLEEIATASSGKVACDSCREPCDDDTPDNRTSIIAEAVVDLLETVRNIENPYTG